MGFMYLMKWQEIKMSGLIAVLYHVNNISAQGIFQLVFMILCFSTWVYFIVWS